MRELLIATTNTDKLREIVSVLDGLPVVLRTLRDFPAIEVPEETGSTFEANARAKALHYAGASGAVTIAEDSGFEVAALDGEPGIYSARYLRPDATYPQRFEEIYTRLRARRAAASAARFVCALAMADQERILFATTGEVNGELAAAPAGTGGFGYDPILYYPPHGRTFGQVSPEEKAAVSHRGQAFRALRAYLANTL